MQEAERGLAAIQMMGNGVIKNRVLAMTGASESIIAYLTKLGVTSAAELTFAQKLKVSTMALWKQAAAWAATPLGMATIAAAGIFAIVKAVDWLTTSLEESREQLEELKEEYNENESELTTLNDELRTTIDRINELQGKGSLTFTEAEELENLMRQNTELERQIALLEVVQKQKSKELQKSFIDTMDKDLGNKYEYKDDHKYASQNYTTQFGIGYVDYSGQVSQTTMSEKDLLYSALIRRNEIYDELQKASAEDRERIQSDLDAIEDYLVSKHQELVDASEGISYINNPTTDDEKKVNEWLDFINDFGDKMMITLGEPAAKAAAKENAFNRLIYGEFSSATSGLKDLGKQGLVTAKHLADSRYDDFIQKCIELGIITDESEASLDFLALGFNSLGKSATNTTSNISWLNEKLETNAKSVDEWVDGVQSKLSSLTDALSKLRDGTMGVNDVIDLLQEFPELARYVDLTADGFGNLEEGLQHLIQHSPDALIAELYKLRDINELTYKEAVLVDDLCLALKKLARVEIDKTLDGFKQFYDTISKTEGLDDGLSQLSGIFNDIKDGDDFDWSSLVNENFAQTFGGLGESYEEFVRTVARAPRDLDACQSAFNELTTAYIANSGALDNVTESNRNVIISMLEQMGVSNAVAVVDAALARDKEYLKYTTGAYADMTYAEVLALYQECEAGSTTEQVLAELAVQKMLTNEAGIQTSSDIDQLIALANSANATTESLSNLAKAKSLIAQAESFTARAKDVQNLPYSAHLASFYESKASALIAEADAYINGQINYSAFNPNNFKVDYTGNYTSGGSGGGGGASSSPSSVDNWFEKQLAEHKHLIAMEQETDAEYLAWLSKAYPQAYKEGIIELEDLYKYQEEVFKGLRDLFMDGLSDVEHEISMRENYDGESRKIIALYEELIKNVEEEIATARARGLTDEDDYIQELQSKWQNYTNAIVDIRDEATEAAKDAIDKLIDYRIEMLEKEADAEKEALDKKLDQLKEFYDKQKELLQKQHDEQKYRDEQTEKRQRVSDLQMELAMLEHDDSAWAQRRKLELQEELYEAKNDLKTFEDDHALDLALDALDNAYNTQEAQIKAEMDALEEKLNDPNALYNRALEDIKNNSENQLYYQMLMYNRQFGDGNDETVNELWSSAYGALNEYAKLFGELYKGVQLENETGETDGNGWDDSPISGTNPNNQKETAGQSGSQSTGSSTSQSSTTESSAPSLSKGSTVTVKESATHFSAKSGNLRMASFVPGGKYTVYQTSGNEVLIGRDGVYTGWINKSDIVGYRSGTDHTIAGLAQFDEDGKGSEYIFESEDGSRYRMFGEGSKVLNANATNFLYEFATSGGGILMKMFSDLFGLGDLHSINKPTQVVQLYSGDINIHGNATEKTVSEIRRTQRANLEFVIKEFNKLNK